MRQFFRNALLYCFFTIVVFCIPVMIKAQGSPGSPVDPACDPQCNCGCTGTWDPYTGACVGGTIYTCPIDNGVYFLLLIGIGYGIYKVQHSKKTTLIEMEKM